MRANQMLEDVLNSMGLRYNVMIEDLEEMIDNEKLSREEQENVTDSTFFLNYQRYDDIVGYFKSLNTQYPDITWYVDSIGESIEGRRIPALHINATTGSGPRRKIYFQSLQHAREWISAPTLLYVVTQLLDNYGKDPTVNRLLAAFEIIVVPTCNPDGYEYSWTRDRMWRKNRRNNGNGIYGVDLNRNWEDHWGGPGSSPNPSSDTYHGKGPFSEPETEALSNYIQKQGVIWGGIDFHAYSQILMRPYGWTQSLCPDDAPLKQIGDGMSFEIRQVHQRAYSSERAAQLYIACGGADDWFYGKKTNPIWATYTIELRDTGQYGFLLPAAQIIPTGQEIYSAMKYYLSMVLQNHPLANQ